MVVCRAAQENKVHVNGVNILTGRKKSQFHAYVACDASAQWHQICSGVVLHAGNAIFQI